MNEKHDVDTDDMLPQMEKQAAPDPLEQAQKDAAEQRLEGGGYGG